MLEGINRQMQNMHGLRSLIKIPLMPPEKLAIAGDDNMQSIPLQIFMEQHLPAVEPTIEKIQNQSYEKLALNGLGDYVTLENFETDDFNIGSPLVME